jgi:hypothetical protein
LELTVRLKPTAAAALTGEAQPNSETEPLARVLEDLGLSLEPMHPGESDPALSSYFTTEVADPQTAERAAEALGRLDAVEGAYTKPAAELP